jgi:hypothetical protein
MRSLWRDIPAVVLLAAFVATAGCAPKGSAMNPGTRTPVQGTPGPAAERARLPEWFPRAVDLRVHPATRYVQERDELILEARIELLDQAGEPIKDIGRFVCELGQVDSNGEVVLVEGRQRVLHFELDVTTAEQHAEYWDPVARAYVLPLKVGLADADLPTGLTRLWVTFRPAWPGSAELPPSTGSRGPVDIRVDW